MTEYVLNDELNVSFPEGFHEMDPEERKNLNFLEEGEGSCFKDPDRHILVSIGWKTINGFASMMLSAKDIAGNMEKTFAQAMASTGYRFVDHLEKKAGTLPGFRYAYTAQGIGMTGESFILKHGKTVYYLHVYVRTELLEESLAVTDAILDSVSIR